MTGSLPTPEKQSVTPNGKILNVDKYKYLGSVVNATNQKRILITTSVTLVLSSASSAPNSGLEARLNRKPRFVLIRHSFVQYYSIVVNPG